MSLGDPRQKTTVEHSAPRKPQRAQGMAVLLLAFPCSAALPLPDPKIPLGRKWFDEHGVADPKISGRHIQIHRSGQSSWIEDLGARNGTWLDGERLPARERVELRDGALLRLGSSLLVYRQSFHGSLEPDEPLGAMVGPYGLRSFRHLLAQLRAAPPSNVLIEGETGTGKELAAHAVARALQRERPFVAVNVAGVAPTVFESQLFGHTAGAFSDARKAAPGIVASHAGGSVFLDEIGELCSTLQPKLLRLLENREVLPVGADRPKQVDVLLIAASNRPLDTMVENGAFRRDLLARLSLARVALPPLRERQQDIFAIARALTSTGTAPLRADQCEVEAIEQMLLQPWPTNVRGVMAFLGELARSDPEPGIRHWCAEQLLGPAAAAAPRGSAVGAELSQSSVSQALTEADGNETRAAKRLGVSRGKLRRFLAKLQGE